MQVNGDVIGRSIKHTSSVEALFRALTSGLSSAAADMLSIPYSSRPYSLYLSTATETALWSSTLSHTAWLSPKERGHRGRAHHGRC